MKNLFIIFGLLLTLSLSAKTNNRVIELSGSIADKYPFKMALSIKSDTVIGYYYYEKYKTKILLVGIVQGTNVILSEGSMMGIYSSELENLSKSKLPQMGFVGELKDSTFVGKWINGEKKLGFTAKVNADNNIFDDKQHANIDGYYEGTIKDGEDNYLVLRHISNGVFYFCISVNVFNASGGMGDLAGIVELKNLQNGSFKDANCKSLDFVVKNNSIIVRENECSFYHGPGCSFDRSFKK